MNYMNNYVYGIFDQDRINEQYKLQHQQLHHENQMLKVAKCVNKLNEFIKSVDEIEPQYQEVAFQQCCSALGAYFMQKSMNSQNDFK